ncbi:MAG TPA: tetratricopeptide repeat protein, partial [Chloroflexota bacterium]
PTSFIGREREIAAISALLTQSAARLITLTGPGGIGKTRLAMRLATHLLDPHAAGAGVPHLDTVCFVSFASIGDHSLVPAAIAGALDVQERGGQGLVQTLIESLRSRRVLLILDNFEHLLEARSLLGELLEACPALRLLVTSRTVLHLSWEHVFEVPPLGLPDTSPGMEPGALAEFEAVALFAERARAVKTDFALTHENVETVAQICRTLEGMPLALELAAARLRLFPPQALLGRLSRRLQILTGGPRDLPARHQTLRAAIDWSYSLLSEEEMRLFARLSVFRGGCTIEAAQAVCDPGGDLGGEILDGVASLVEKSLVRQGGELEPRFLMLETIREYAAERLEESRASEELKEEHARYCLALAEEAASLPDITKQVAWLGQLEVERDNVRAALQWARESGDVDLGLRLAISLREFWLVRGPLSEGRRWLEELAASEGGSPASRAAALSAAGKLASAEGRRRTSAQLVERSLALYRELGDRRGVAKAVGWLAVSWYMTGEVDRAFDLLQQSESEARETGDQMLLAASLRFHASLAAERGDPQQSRSLGEEGLSLYRRMQDSEGIVDVLRVLAGTAYAAGDMQNGRAWTDELLTVLRQLPLDPEQEEWLQGLAYRARMLGDNDYATRIVEELMARGEAFGDRRIAAQARTALGLLAREQGDYGRAARLYEESAAVLEEVGDVLGRCRALVGLSDVARDRGDAERVIELCEESLALLRESGDAFLTGFALHNLGLAAWYQGNRSRAENHFAESLSLFQRQKSAADTVEVHTSMGLLALDGGQYDRAGEIFAECLETARKSESRWLMGALLESMASVAAATGQPERAATLFGAAEALRLAMGTPRWPALQSFYDRYVTDARTALGEETFRHVLEQGQTLSLDQAVTLALQEITSP